jgi:hypothetical protein
VAPFDENEDDDSLLGEPEFDPDSLGPRVDIPEAPEIGEGGDSDEVAQIFWIVVIMVDVGLFATSIGVMIVVFRDQLRLGGGVFSIGVLALLFAYRHYWRYQNS